LKLERRIGFMGEPAIKLGGKKQSKFIDKVKEVLPEGGNLNLCLTCGACSSGCPATGLEGMDPRKFLRMAALGMDEEIMSSKWTWMCTMCTRCMYVCPMKINIPQLVFNARKTWPREDRPKGILGSCDVALKNDTCSAMGTTEEDFQFVVEDVLEEYQESQPEFKDMKADINREGAEFFLNQNSREPVTEPDEMVPLWKILHSVGADWTYSTKGWAAENYCMFMADDDAWKHIIEVKQKAVEDLGCKVWLNTE
jgi:ferredoxin